MYIRLGLAKYFLAKSYKLRRELCALTFWPKAPDGYFVMP